MFTLSVRHQTGDNCPINCLRQSHRWGDTNDTRMIMNAKILKRWIEKGPTESKCWYNTKSNREDSKIAKIRVRLNEFVNIVGTSKVEIGVESSKMDLLNVLISRFKGSRSMRFSRGLKLACFDVSDYLISVSFIWDFKCYDDLTPTYPSSFQLVTIFSYCEGVSHLDAYIIF